MRRLSPFLTLLLLALVCLPAGAVTITIVNKDAAGKGLNDPTAAAPVGGNPGTTIGEQRMNVFKEAARIWGQILPGNVEIRVDASFTDDTNIMTCTETSATLGGTSPTYVEAQFAGAPEYQLWYVVAEANQLSGTDLEPGESDMAAQFNAKLGQPGCLTGTYFYYGFDANTPSGQINFLTVALHEFAHGLGFLSVASTSTGAFLGGRGDIFSKHMLDTASGKTWTQMASDAERKNSTVDTGHIVWSGAATSAAGTAYLSGHPPALVVSAPAAVADSYTVGTASFGAALTLAGVSGQLVAALDPSDASGASTTDACSALTNASAVAGKIALVDRGSCNFTVKAANVQAAGAIGVVVANNASGAPPGLGGTDPTITIPAVSVTQADGAKLRANLPATATIGLDPSRAAGMGRSGQVLLYAPNPVETGSSLSHFDKSASPNLLMEPNISSDLPIGVDITPALLADIGWFGSTPCPTIGLSPATLPNGTVGVAYGPVTLTPAAGTAPFSFFASDLPPGLSLTTSTSTAVISGTPTALFSGAVTVGGADGNACAFSQDFYMGVSAAAGPVADFTWTAASPNAGDPVQFTDASTGSPTSWLWNFGDGTTSTDRNPAHTFGKGTYAVSLTASNAGGSSTKTQSVVVSFGGPVACTPDLYRMCMIGGRYRVTSHWKNQYAGGAEANLSKASLTDATGAFWLTDPAVYEYLIRLNTATDNGRVWVAIPTFTDVEFWIAVFDTQNGQYKEYHSPAGNRTLLYDPFFFVYP
ncbi:MAG TPA: PKD domain-containing protein [Thermoanaerobaculia bacterium]|nr:PKD domain-containing protein [Thermoanaerobaculia bacterium]